MLKGLIIHDYLLSSGVIFLAVIYGTFHLLRHQRRGPGKGDGDADICKCILLTHKSVWPT